MAQTLGPSDGTGGAVDGNLIPLNNFGLPADAPVGDYLAAARASGTPAFVIPGGQVTAGGLVVLPHAPVVSQAQLIQQGWTATQALLAADASGIGAKFSQVGTAAHGAVTSAAGVVGWLANNRGLVIVGALAAGVLVLSEAL